MSTDPSQNLSGCQVRRRSHQIQPCPGFDLTVSLDESTKLHLHLVCTDKSNPVVVGGHGVNQNRDFNHFYGW